MNILPKKSWHVRNKNNIERVRRDEENAAKEEKERQRRKALAESEARTDLLRQKARKRTHSDSKEKHSDIVSSSKHINFFEDLEKGNKLGGKNAEHEEEKRKEKEAYEKSIGLLTYLGQSSAELSDEKPWYYKAPARNTETNNAELSKGEVDTKRKRSIDPLYSMDKYVSVSKKVEQAREGKTAKRPEPRSTSTSTSSAGPQKPKTIEELRAERLKREQDERKRELEILAKAHGHLLAENQKDDKTNDERNMRYNSQFNPEFVRRPRPPKSHTQYER